MPRVTHGETVRLIDLALAASGITFLPEDYTIHAGALQKPQRFYGCNAAFSNVRAGIEPGRSWCRVLPRPWWCREARNGEELAAL